MFVRVNYFPSSGCRLVLTVCKSYVIMILIYDWCEERLELQGIADDIISKFIPPHVNIFYCFGGVVFTTYIIQIGSGFGLTLYYNSCTLEAYSSVISILSKVNYGWLLHSIHRWSSDLMVLILMLHIIRVYLTGGFKKPRELVWITGVFLCISSISFGVTGYSLPWDRLGFWACKIVTAVPEALDNFLPGAGKTLVSFLRGGSSVSQHTLIRFYNIHTFILPLVTLPLVLIHFSIIRKQGISGPL